jgi:hypothetical protein
MPDLAMRSHATFARRRRLSVALAEGTSRRRSLAARPRSTPNKPCLVDVGKAALNCRPRKVGTA